MNVLFYGICCVCGYKLQVYVGCWDPPQRHNEFKLKCIRTLGKVSPDFGIVLLVLPTMYVCFILNILQYSYSVIVGRMMFGVGFVII